MLPDQHSFFFKFHITIAIILRTFSITNKLAEPIRTSVSLLSTTHSTRLPQPSSEENPSLCAINKHISNSQTVKALELEQLPFRFKGPLPEATPDETLVSNPNTTRALMDPLGREEESWALTFAVKRPMISHNIVYAEVKALNSFLIL